MTEFERAQAMIAKWRTSQTGVRFSDLAKVYHLYFGEPRRKGSHLIYRTPWRGLPRVNIQDSDGEAKPYQVRQVLRASHLAPSEAEALGGVRSLVVDIVSDMRANGEPLPRPVPWESRDSVLSGTAVVSWATGASVPD